MIRISLFPFLIGCFSLLEIVVCLSRECVQCDGSYGDWNTWGECGGGDCHKENGRQTKSRSCLSLDDVITCRQRETRPCVNEQSCLGEWVAWSRWGGCSKVNASSACTSTRYRWCQGTDRGQLKDIGSLMCYGGVDGSMKRKTCEAGSCGKDVRVNIKPSSKANQPIPGPNPNKESVDEAAGPNTPRLFESNDVKSSGDSKNQHTTLLIIGVGFGSLIVGGVVMLFAVRMRRHRTLRKSAAGSYRGRKNLLSVSFSTNTEPSIERFSPTTQTTVDANADFELLTRQDYNPSRAVGSNSSITTSTPSTSGESSQSHHLLQVPKQSLQENVYWEIKDQRRISVGDRPYSFADEQPGRKITAIGPEYRRNELQRHKIHRNRLNGQNASPGEPKMVENVLYTSIGS